MGQRRVDHDTARCAAASIGRRWREMGGARYPRATRPTITADGGGSDPSCNRLWDVALPLLADETGLTLAACDFPPGTTKRNKAGPRLFCFVARNWRGRPPTRYRAIVDPIGSTTTKAGLTVRAARDTAEYDTGIEVTDEELARVNCTRATFHGDWNHTTKVYFFARSEPGVVRGRQRRHAGARPSTWS